MEKAKLVERYFWDGENKWYAGVELFGEGIFLDVAPKQELRVGSEYSDRWERLLSRIEYRRAHPVSVWWHSLSHRIITALATDSGYSSAGASFPPSSPKHCSTSEGLKGMEQGHQRTWTPVQGGFMTRSTAGQRHEL